MHNALESPSATVRCASSLVEGEGQLPEEHLTIRDAIHSACAIEKAHIDELYPLVDLLMMNADERIIVSNLTLRDSFRAGLQFWNLSLFFRSSKAYSMWRSCLKAAIHHLDLPATISSGLCSVDTICLTSTMTLDEMQKILEYLKPLLHRSHFERIFISEESGVSVQICGDFIGVASVKTIDFWSATKEEVKDFEPWLNMVRKIEPLSVKFFRIELTPDLANFLANIADITESIYITHWSTTGEDLLPISILKEIFTKRCRQLHFADGDGSFKYSQAHVAELVQFLKESDKRISLVIPTASDISEDRIGDYNLKFDEKKDSMLVIHCEMEQKETDELLNYNHSRKHSRPTTTCAKRSLASTPSFDTPPATKQTIESNSVKDNNTLAIRQMIDTAQAFLSIQNEKLFEIEKELKTDNTKTIEAEKLWLRRIGFGNEIELTVFFSSSLHQGIWRAFFISALSKIGFHGHDVFTGNKREELNSHTVSWTQPHSTIEQADLCRLAMLLKTIAVRITFKKLNFDANHLGMVNFCVDLVEQYHVRAIHIRPWRFTSADDKTEIHDFTPWIDMVNKIKPTDVKYTRVQPTNGLMQFLVNVADVAQTIRVMPVAFSDCDVFPITFIHKLLLSSKCTSVTVYDKTKITVHEAQSLLQLFHHSEKKMSLRIEIDAMLQETTIGEYTFTTSRFGFHDNQHMLIISHNDQWCPSE